MVKRSRLRLVTVIAQILGLFLAAPACDHSNSRTASSVSARPLEQPDHDSGKTIKAPVSNETSAPKTAGENTRYPPLQHGIVDAVHLWLMQMRAIPIGEVVEMKTAGNPMYVTDNFGLTTDDPFINLGFKALPETIGHWQRVVHLDETVIPALSNEGPLALSEMPTLPDIDCIAISSINRRHAEKVYVYDTLRSLFQVFPAEAQINVLVGNADANYLSMPRLVEEVGGRDATRVHVVSTSPEIADYLLSLPLPKRGGWNFSRALLGYTGSRGIILLEDDIDLPKGSPELLQSVLQQAPLPIVSLYNHSCENLPGRRSVAQEGSFHAEVPERWWGFQWYSTGLYIAAPFARPLGAHHLVHLNSFCWDKLINYFLAAHNLDVAYTYPSMIQHRGLVSTGTWGQHESHCYLGDMGGF